MTKSDVLECFNMAVKEVVEAEKSLLEVSPESGFVNPDGVITNLCQVLLQAHQIEEQDKRVVPATATMPANLRSIN